MDASSFQSLLSRRRFLHGGMVLGLGSLLAPFASGSPLSSSSSPAMPVVDPSLDAWLSFVDQEPRLSSCQAVFPSFFGGGFECSTHIYHGRRLDMIRSTNHDRFARADYERLKSAGILGCRDGISWVASEPYEGRFDLSRARSMARAAREAGIVVAWDFMHFGWPPHVDVFAKSFPSRFRRYAVELTRVLLDEGAPADLIISPINEISFLSWAAGEVGFFFPNARERGPELKVQLVRAAIEAMSEIRRLAPKARFLHCDPLIHVAPATEKPRDYDSAELQTEIKYQAWDMLSGRIRQQTMGGASEFVDVIGVDYYAYNQRFSDGKTLPPNDSRYKPLSVMLSEVFDRYGKPLLVAETGAEDGNRALWLRYVAAESRKALELGCPLHGAVWYPIVNHPGWRDDRHVRNGLWEYADMSGNRTIYDPLARTMAQLELPLSQLRSLSLANHAAPVGCKREQEP